MNTNIIKIAVLSEFWEKQKKDIIDLLIPFVKICINDHYYGNFKIIDFDEVHSELTNIISPDFTRILLTKVINRMCSMGILEIKDDNYCLINESEINNAVEMWIKAKEEVDEKWNELVSDLNRYILKNEVISYFDSKNVENLLWNALNNRLDLANNDIEKLNNITVASYFIEKEKIKDKYYDYINQFSCSIFISNSIGAISKMPANEKFPYNQFYIDTRFLMNVLELNTDFDNSNAKELFNKIKDCGGKMFTFVHNVNEMKNVINQYIKQKFSMNYVSNNIEFFEKNNYDKTQCEYFRSAINSIVKQKDIEIIDTNSIIIDEKLEKRLSNEFDENYIEKESGREYDKLSYIYVCKMHDTNKEFLFVSTSNSLNNLYKKTDNNEVLFISDVSLASLLFAYGNSMFANAQYNSILSKSWLIQRPSSEIANGIIARIKKMVDAGILDSNALHYFMTDKIALRDLYVSTLADNENFDFKAKNMFDNYINNIVKVRTDEIIKDNNSKIELLNEEVKNNKQEKERLLVYSKKLKDEKEDLFNKIELKDGKISLLEDQKKVLLNEKNEDKRYIANFESSIRDSSARCAKLIVGIIVLIFFIIYILILCKMVIPEAIREFKQSPIYAIFGLAQILICGGLVLLFVKKIPIFYKNISYYIYRKKIKRLR